MQQLRDDQVRNLVVDEDGNPVDLTLPAIDPAPDGTAPDAAPTEASSNDADAAEAAEAEESQA